MAKKKKRKRPSAAKNAKAASKESQRAEAITVFWMMALLATVISEASWLVAKLIIALVSPYPALVLLSGLLLLIACVTGLICIALTPLVLRWRRISPPPVITRFALAAGFLPWVTLAAVSVFGRQ